jgi:hypothetical protein
MHGINGRLIQKRIIERTIITIIFIAHLNQSKMAVKGFFMKLPIFEKKGFIPFDICLMVLEMAFPVLLKLSLKVFFISFISLFFIYYLRDVH